MTNIEETSLEFKIERKKRALLQIETLLSQLQELGSKIEDLMCEEFPMEATRIDAYGGFDFGSSRNPYDTTLESELTEIRKELYEEYDD